MREASPISPLPQTPSGVMEDVSERLLGRIVDGAYAAGSRLPSERDLAQELGASRVAVREALRRLAEWRMVSIRRGSGATVIPRLHWSSMALWGVFRHTFAQIDPGFAASLADDALALRRQLVCNLVTRAASHLQGMDLSQEEALLDQAWDAREQPNAFVVLDRELLPRILERAGMLASLWTLNSLADMYLHIMQELSSAFRVPASYRPQMRAMLGALQRGNAEEACAALRSYLRDLDQAVLAALPPDIASRLTR